VTLHGGVVGELRGSPQRRRFPCSFGGGAVPETAPSPGMVVGGSYGTAGRWFRLTCNITARGWPIGTSGHAEKRTFESCRSSSFSRREPSLLCLSTIKTVVAGRPSSPHPLVLRTWPPSPTCTFGPSEEGHRRSWRRHRAGRRYGEGSEASLLEASEGSTGGAARRGSGPDRSVVRGRYSLMRAIISSRSRKLSPFKPARTCARVTLDCRIVLPWVKNSRV